MKTSDVLRKAGDVLRERGWCQRQFCDEKGAVCAYGAVREVTGPDHWIPHVAAFDLVVETSRVVMPLWNDISERTADEVLVAMDAAYVVALQEEGIEPGDVL